MCPHAISKMGKQRGISRSELLRGRNFKWRDANRVVEFLTPRSAHVLFAYY